MLKIFNLVRTMHPVTYIRTMLVMIGLQYSAAVAVAGMQCFVLAIIFLVSATVSLTGLLRVIRR